MKSLPPALFASLLLATILSSRAEAQSEPHAPPRVGQRPPWTTSKFAGTPDPAPPYRAEAAFPRLTFDRPVLIDHVPGTDRLVVGEVGGKVLSFVDDPEVDRADTALELADDRPGAVQLYGLAFHPRFATNRQVFVCYVAKNDDPDGTRVSRFVARQADPLAIDRASEEVLLTFRSGGHNGGCLAFANDGFLYISTGDAGVPTPPDPLRTGQDLSDLLGAILRIDVDHRGPGKAYRVPPDNPFLATRHARPEIWAYGLRNPWRMSVDHARGDLWVGDVGWELWEMIFLVRPGMNCGWSLKEGPQPVRSDIIPGPTPIVPPVVAHPHSEAASITGGYVYHGERLESLKGAYIYGDYQSGKVWGLRHDGQRVTWRGELADTGLRLVSFGEGRAGEFYLVEFERTNQIYRLVPNPSAGARAAFPRTLSETGLFASTRDFAPAPGVVPFAINASLWSDGATAERLLAVPGEARVQVDDRGRWRPPDGSVLARTVSLDLVAGDPRSRRRLETQVLHREAGSWRPYTYIWDDDQSDATLADAAGSTRTFSVRDLSAPGGSRQHTYRFAARSECALCHNPWVEASNVVYGRQSASPLALTTAQLDRGDQLRRFEALGLLAPGAAGNGPRLADPRDLSAPLDARARSYLQANCAHCHREGAGGSANLVLVADVPLAATRALDGVPLQGAFGLPDARIIAPGEPERSVLYYRMAKLGSGRMPRAGSSCVDPDTTRLIADWIASLPRTAGHGPAHAPDRAIAEAIDAIASPGPDRPRALARLVGSTYGALALVRAIDAGEVPAPIAREAARLAGTSASPEVIDLLDRFLPESERSRRLGPSFDPAVVLARRGDPARGRAIFRAGGQAACRGCHTAEGDGTAIGPALDGIGSKYSRAELLSHVVEPSKLVDPKYASFTVSTREGRVLTGILVEETPSTLTLRDAANRTLRLHVAEIDERRRDMSSLMPEGLLAGFTAEQAADLLDYLTSLKAPPVGR